MFTCILFQLKSVLMKFSSPYQPAQPINLHILNSRIDLLPLFSINSKPLTSQTHAPLSERCFEQNSLKNGVHMCLLLMKLKWVLMFPFSPYQSSKLINLHTHIVRRQIKIWFDVPLFLSSFTDLNNHGLESWSALTHVFFHSEIIASGRHPSIRAVVERPK